MHHKLLNKYDEIEYVDFPNNCRIAKKLMIFLRLNKTVSQRRLGRCFVYGFFN